MLKTVFVLGAGASADAGIPVMSNFLDRAEDYSNNGSFGEEERSDFETVSKAIYALKGATFNTVLDLNNIETVFSAVDMARLIDCFVDMAGDEIENVYSSLVRLIGATIDHSTGLIRKTNGMKLEGTYHEFVDFIRDKFHIENKWLSSIVTFNYDIALEYALHYVQIYPDYHLPGQYKADPLALLKLHGSVNWSQTEDGKKISPINLSGYLSRVGVDGAGKSAHLLMSKNVGILRGDNHRYLNKPLIVPPSWNKSEYYELLRPVWKKAAEVLGNAQAIYVIGYSLPETDMFFRYLFALGTHTRNSIRRFWVFDPDPKVGKRFEMMLAPGLNDGRRYQYYEKNFNDAVVFLSTNVDTD